MSLSFGISPALVTPFSDGRVDVQRLASHANDCLARGCRTATIFGTTGEGPSVGAIERERVTVDLISLGIPAITLDSGGTGGRAHALDEWIDVEKKSSVKGINLVMATLLALSGVE